MACSFNRRLALKPVEAVRCCARVPIEGAVTVPRFLALEIFSICYHSPESPSLSFAGSGCQSRLFHNLTFLHRISVTGSCMNIVLEDHASIHLLACGSHSHHNQGRERFVKRFLNSVSRYLNGTHRGVTTQVVQGQEIVRLWQSCRREASWRRLKEVNCLRTTRNRFPRQSVGRKPAVLPG